MSVVTAAEVVRLARRSAGLTQAELASRLGGTQAGIARLERRGANPTVHTLERTLRAAGHRLVLDLEPIPPSVDETLIAENLRLTPAQRLTHFGAAYWSLRELAPTRRTG